MGLSYKDSGVNIEAGNRLVSAIKKRVESTFGPEVLTGPGGFAGLFAPDLRGYREPVLVAGTDGVGTKLKIAFLLDRHDSIGIDLVAMCVNDILAQGAKPLFFLDYLATGKLQPDQALEVIKGITTGCQEAGCALIGGETAEMPQFYRSQEYDLAGFAVGLVDRKKIISGKDIKAGDQLIGLSSSGLHSNGYSLARKVFLEHGGLKLDERPAGLKETLGEELLKPTRIYVRVVLELLRDYQLKGIAHITGGGLLENIPRILPGGLTAVLDRSSWPLPEVFKLLQELGEIETGEMYRTFNMGIGMVLAVRREDAEGLLEAAARMGEEAYLIGEIREMVDSCTGDGDTKANIIDKQDNGDERDKADQAYKAEKADEADNTVKADIPDKGDKLDETVKTDKQDKGNKLDETDKVNNTNTVTEIVSADRRVIIR